jgi:hypothetical protein
VLVLVLALLFVVVVVLVLVLDVYFSRDTREPPIISLHHFPHHPNNPARSLDLQTRTKDDDEEEYEKDDDDDENENDPLLHHSTSRFGRSLTLPRRPSITPSLPPR